VIGQGATRWWVLCFLCIAGAGPRNPARYDAMLWFFGIQSLTALVAVVLLWRRESGPHGHGLESARQGTTA